MRHPAESNTRDDHEEHTNDEDGESGGEQDKVSEEASSKPEYCQFPVDEDKLRVGPGHQIPTFQFLSHKPLCDLILDDAGHTSLYIVENIS